MAASFFFGASILVACFVSSLPHPARAQAVSGFNFCAPPHRPACVSENSSKIAANACDEEIKSYIATVFRYRECLETESERAVRESNEVIDQWRCRQSGERCKH